MNDNSYEAQSQPDRYAAKRDEASPEIECFDAIWAARGSEAAKEYCIAAAIKYLWRLGHKDDELKESNKIKVYMDLYQRVLAAEAKAGEDPSAEAMTGGHTTMSRLMTGGNPTTGVAMQGRSYESEDSSSATSD